MPEGTGDPPVVVAAAILHGDGRVLAAQRRRPPHLAGLWELPGGKVEPGERDEDALVRECREELGVDVSLGERIGDTWPGPDGFVLRVWTARVTSGDVPRPLDHAALQWVPPDELQDVAWLPGDEALAMHLAAVLAGDAEERPLAGGNVGGAVRIGRTVRRPCGFWSEAVHALMRHARDRGVPGVPRVFGVDDRGREVTEFIDGDVTPDGPWAPWALTDAFLGDVGAWLRTFHEAVAGFPSDGLRFRLTEPRPLAPGELVCHNDIDPHNLVGSSGRLAGVLDWDAAGPCLPVLDLAYTAWGFAIQEQHARIDVRAARVRTLCAAYGIGALDVLDAVEARVHLLADTVRAGAAAGDEGLRHLLALGEIDRHLARLSRFREEKETFARLLS
ncbi:MAG TPA: NUDIX domain-containing protein [Streptosporangiales bacterium]